MAKLMQRVQAMEAITYTHDGHLILTRAVLNRRARDLPDDVLLAIAKMTEEEYTRVINGGSCIVPPGNYKKYEDMTDEELEARIACLVNPRKT